ncbi:MAG: hypothetical protein WCA28_14620 [Bradyrhizobium sp.]
MTLGIAVTGWRRSTDLLTFLLKFWTTVRSGEERRQQVYETGLYEIQMLMREFESKIPTQNQHRVSSTKAGERIREPLPSPPLSLPCPLATFPPANERMAFPQALAELKK